MNLYKISTFSFLFYVLLGCNSFLDEIPDNRITIDTPQEIEELLVGAYPTNVYHQFVVSAADNVTDAGPAIAVINDVNEKGYQFEDWNSDDSRDTSVAFWNSCYAAIGSANRALEAIEKMGNPASLNARRGEALLCRAYSHFLLVSVFAMRYDPATASTRLGVPYITEVEKNAIKLYKRGTIKQNYDNIRSDLETGLPLITNEYKNPKFHFNKDAANAFAARFYLHTAEWEQVLKYTGVILSTRNLDTAAKGYNTAVYTSSNYAPRATYYESHLTDQNLLISYANSVFRRTIRNNRYGLTLALSGALFNVSKIPFSAGGLSWGYIPYSVNRTIYYLPHYNEYFRVTNVLANTGFPYISFIHFGVDEVLYNRAEAFVMTGQYDNALAVLKASLGRKVIGYDKARDQLSLSDLQPLFPPVPNELTPFYEGQLDNDKRVLLKAILEYKRLELFSDGHRWFDIKRYDIVVIHKNVKNETFILRKDDPRRAFQVPSVTISFGMKPNSR